MENSTRKPINLASPVDLTNTGSEHPQRETGAALCLSGGGYHAMVFHAGALWRLYEANLIKDLKRISSVSGGSITAAVLGLKMVNAEFRPGCNNG